MTEEKTNNTTTVIDATTVVKGNIKIKNDCEIYGLVQGNVDSSANVKVCPGGVIEGNLRSEYAEISGETKGDVEIYTSLTITSTGVLNKRFKTARLIIEDGAQF